VSGPGREPTPEEVRRGQRLRLYALAWVVALAVAALAYGLLPGGDGRPDDGAPVDPDAREGELVGLQERAALDPCPPGLGPALPDLVLPCLGGGPPVDLRSAPPGRPTLVNVWASWCAPCVDEVPDLVAFRERAGDRVGVVGVLTTDTRRSALTFAGEFGMRWPSLVDDDGLVLRAFLPGPPVTLFLDAEGRVVHKRSGAFRDLAEIEALVAEHLGVVL
jgi:cytochrome c biogenesis protein CcmG, thiol:disulfide interchange protein DsbE